VGVRYGCVTRRTAVFCCQCPNPSRHHGRARQRRRYSAGPRQTGGRLCPSRPSCSNCCCRRSTPHTLPGTCDTCVGCTWSFVANSLVVRSPFAAAKPPAASTSRSRCFRLGGLRRTDQRNHPTSSPNTWSSFRGPQYTSSNILLDLWGRC